MGERDISNCTVLPRGVMWLTSRLADQMQAKTINEVIDAMTEKLHDLKKTGDHRVVFHHVYLLMTKEMKKRLSSGFFSDPDWMERVLVSFAHYYFQAIEAYELGLPCPPAWEHAFRLATQKKGLVLQDALLGINAHINNDLPMVMYGILTEDQAWPDARIMLHRRQDHDRINDVLSELIDLVQEELSQHYGRFIRFLDFVMGRKDESLFAFILAHCRTNVWYNTELLLNASDENQWNLQRKQIENDALSIGKKIANSHSVKVTKYLAIFSRKIRWF